MRKDRLAYKTMGFEHRYVRLKSLIDISRTINQETDLPALLDRITKETSRVIGAERSTVFLFDKDTNELWSIVAEGESGEIRISADKGVAGHVFQTGEVQVVDDAYSDPHFNATVDKSTGFVTRNIVTVPISDAWGRMQGVFQVLNKKDGSFQREDIEFIRAIAAQSALTIHNLELLEARKRMFDSLVNVMAESIESRDPLTAGHSLGVMKYSMIIATEMGYSDDEIEVIRYAALLHDYGKIGIPDKILQKPSRLTAEEYETIKKHVVYTDQIITKIDFEEKLKSVPEYASQHHERIDGSGYPKGLVGDEISQGGKIIAVADVFDALTAVRHYREPMAITEAMQVLIEGIGVDFEKEVVVALRSALVKSGKTELEKLKI